MTANPPDSATQDKAVKLARAIMERPFSIRDADPSSAAQIILAQAVIDMQGEIARLYALRLDDAAQVTALRTALEFYAVRSGNQGERARAALSASPLAAPDATKEGE